MTRTAVAAVERRTTSRRGFGLLVALVTLALLAGGIAVAWRWVLQGQRVATALESGHDTSNGSEAALARAAAAWDASWGLTLPVGGSLTVGPFAEPGGVRDSAVLTRLTRSLILLSSGAAARVGTPVESHREHAMLYHLALPELGATAVVTVRDSLLVRGGARVTGSDSLPPGWSGTSCPLLSPVAGAAAPDTTHVCDGSCGAPAGAITGLPAVTSDSAAGDSRRYLLFGGETWASLTAAATVLLAPNAHLTPAPVASGATCDRAVTTNWGDPGRSSVCADYFPLIVASGDLTIDGGMGQGILLVNGDLTLMGGARFTGVVVLQDDLRTGSGGGVVHGRVLAGDRRTAAGDVPLIQDGSVIQYSTCAIDHALLGSAALRPVTGRAWAPVAR